MDRDEKYMQMAIAMAEGTVGQTSPNPSVAAVVVRDNQVVGLGVHVKAGEPHAEVHALKMAGEKAEGAEIYVTLEPCSHYGQTPPCAQAVIDAGIKRAIIASHDPNPKVSGRGIQMMEEAGIEVKTAVLKEKADQLNRAFFHFIQTKRPYVRLKSAISMDGKIATSTGESQWITGVEARLDGHRYRHQSAAILVGVNTVMMDNPKLTTRLEGGGDNPVRIVLDTNLRTPPAAQLIQDPSAPTWIFTGAGVTEEQLTPFRNFSHVDIIQFQSDKVDIEEVVDFLGEQKITSLLIEGGATVADAFVRSGHVNEVITYMAPKVIGGEKSLTSVAGEGISSLKNIDRFEFVSSEKIGDDLKIIAVKKEG
ncbi:bifunctional diaminohydroxyphosphoribosylaminopyrimidine deaminase/5-amino-6-(5-phosphoribosylamino)uracil reductase RibD [Halobacillus sp. A1]|uniref:bifunctional diaminohydroxyphosphoribosylaminopyrimidine deaminase/5-amino-6-(5-phosphoribosylamino)uracil reductase RibD n=1 Tax=Halobacillus sp. A1 TaxID=2880262 RepID=UPI0020A69C36|nr:bifunctional diaminohydroxyphosphoribosylaminopyrimidine deaminase/5-amino-6-(5-phosphoribosylamino)uracil reductase RibD [Halobacillus sp. A1]MCP3033017.1 bifunctional diaminohydroxyphosphoribosylaminopyrimidine deaminase/5-amino-6-(5-phosphoribosylamino)uracil reductase RibD [Halobacillus sp. A1]